MAKMGRPTKYTEELGLEICKRISNGESLSSVCRDEKMPNRITVHDWMFDEDKKDFYNNYEKAVNVRTDKMFDELEEIADLSDEKESPMRSRLRVDTRKWYLSKVMPKKYGEKLDMTTGGEKIPFNIISFKNDNTDEPVS